MCGLCDAGNCIKVDCRTQTLRRNLTYRPVTIFMNLRLTKPQCVIAPQQFWLDTCPFFGIFPSTPAHLAVALPLLTPKYLYRKCVTGRKQ